MTKIHLANISSRMNRLTKGTELDFALLQPISIWGNDQSLKVGSPSRSDLGSIETLTVLPQHHIEDLREDDGLEWRKVLRQTISQLDVPLAEQLKPGRVLLIEDFGNSVFQGNAVFDENKCTTLSARLRSNKEDSCVHDNALNKEILSRKTSSLVGFQHDSRLVQSQQVKCQDSLQNKSVSQGRNVQSLQQYKWKVIRMIRKMFGVQESGQGMFARECGDQIAEILNITCLEDWKTWWQMKKKKSLKSILENAKLKRVILHFINPSGNITRVPQSMTSIAVSRPRKTDGHIRFDATPKTM